MLKSLKFRGEEKKFLFISDLHINHDRPWIVQKRKFSSIIEHDEGIINNWNSVCNNKSIIFNLGDVQFNDPDGSKFLQLMRRLNFDTQYILWGNHTSGHRQTYIKEMKKQFPNSVNSENGLEYEVYPLTLILDGIKKIIFLPEYVEVVINGTYLVLCHYALYCFNKQAHGALSISGHSHSNCPLTNKNTGQGKRLDVGVESFGQPINLSEIKNLLKNRLIDSSDHHRI